jgi:hypothetical protein
MPESVLKPPPKLPQSKLLGCIPENYQTIVLFLLEIARPI